MTSDKLQMISASPRINEMLRISMNFESRIPNSESRIENRKSTTTPAQNPTDNESFRFLLERSTFLFSSRWYRIRR